MIDEVLTVIFGTAIVLGDERVCIHEDTTHGDSIDVEVFEEIVAGDLPPAFKESLQAQMTKHSRLLNSTTGELQVGLRKQVIGRLCRLPRGAVGEGNLLLNRPIDGNLHQHIQLSVCIPCRHVHPCFCQGYGLQSTSPNCFARVTKQKDVKGLEAHIVVAKDVPPS